MTAQEVLQTVATLPTEDCLAIQSGIAEMLSARFSEGEVAEIREALTEAEAEWTRGERLSSAEMRSHFGLR